MRAAKKSELNPQDGQILKGLAKRMRIKIGMQQLACIILVTARGKQNETAAVEAKRDRRQVALWRHRFPEGDIAALRHEVARPGCPTR